MKTYQGLAGLFLIFLAGAAARPADLPDGFVPLFNGKDLTGWVNVNCAPGTFFVKDGQIITTGKPTGFLRTEKQYENFIAEFEWMHLPPKPDAPGNSGFFVWGDPLPGVGSPFTRGIEVQVLVNLEKENAYTSHGDVFSIQGATCKPDRPHPMGWARCLPSERRAKGAGEWNHYKVVANDGVIKLHVNGKEVSGVSECKPRKGYLALESEGSECRFRNLWIKELPSSNPKKDEIAEEAKGFVAWFTGFDQPGQTLTAEQQKHWQMRDWMVHYDGKADGINRALAPWLEVGDSSFIIDFRFPDKKGEKPAPCTFVLRNGPEKRGVELTLTPEGKYALRGVNGESSGEYKDLKPIGQWNRLQATIDGKSLKVTINGKALGSFELTHPAKTGAFALIPEGEMDFANLFVR
jgi:hypothetical protein